MLYNLEKNTNVKTKQFPRHKSYKSRESTLYCIGNSEGNIDLSDIYLAVFQNSYLNACSAEVASASDFHVKSLKFEIAIVTR